MFGLTNTTDWIDTALKDADVYSKQRSLRRLHAGPASEVYLVEGAAKYPNGLVIKRSGLGSLRAIHVTEIYHELIVGEMQSTLLYASLEGDDNVVTIDEWRPGHAGSCNDFDVVFNSLLEIHSHQARRSAPSTYRNVNHEVSWGKMQSDALIRDSAHVIETGLTSGFNSHLRFQGVWTHGDAKPSNCLVNNGELLLIDWDKSCSISPLLDLAFAYYCFVPEFTSAQTNPPIHCLDYDSGDPKCPALGDVLSFSDSLHFLHDAFRSRESSNRMSYFRDEAAPRHRVWLDVKGNLR